MNKLKVLNLDPIVAGTREVRVAYIIRIGNGHKALLVCPLSRHPETDFTDSPKPAIPQNSR